MTRNQIIFTIGVVVVVTQFLGIPYMWKNIVYLIAGLLLILLSALVYAREHHLFPNDQSPEPLDSDTESNRAPSPLSQQSVTTDEYSSVR
jgi:hypothetical protein